MSSLIEPRDPRTFVGALAAAFLAPALIPGMGIDYPYFFIMVLVLAAWFSFKWPSVKGLSSRGGLAEVSLGFLLIAGDYAQNIYFRSELGVLDIIVIFSSLALIFYGVRSLRLFWVPAAYGIILLLGYQLESLIPNYVALQQWLASLMASAMQGLGVTAVVSGQIVYLNTGETLIGLNVESACTGLQGILAFGMLSTMAVLDVKVKASRLVPLLALGFAGAFLINIARLFVVFVTFEYLGIGLGTAVHVYAGYLLFVAWVMVFWMIAFRYLAPSHGSSSPAVGTGPNAVPGRGASPQAERGTCRRAETTRRQLAQTLFVSNT